MPDAIPLARPNITEAEIEAVTDLMRTPNLSLGPKLRSFEEAFAKQCGTDHAVACSSGTAGLHMLMEGLDLDGEDEVITTPFSFVASANCILMAGARVVFADIDPQTWNLAPARVEAAITERTRAIVAVDVFGQPAEFDLLAELAAQHDLSIIEDSCEALGATYKGRPAGGLARAGVFGFYPNKQITTGEGGMVVTDDADLAALCVSLRNQGRSPDGGWLAHERLGYNYRMCDINAALGLTQLGRLSEILATRSAVYEMYRQRLANEPRVTLQVDHPDTTPSRFVIVVRLADSYEQHDRDRILAALAERGIGCSNYFVPIHLQPFYQSRFGFAPGDFPVCEALAARTIALPFHHELRAEDIDRICHELGSLL